MFFEAAAAGDGRAVVEGHSVAPVDLGGDGTRTVAVRREEADQHVAVGGREGYDTRAVTRIRLLARYEVDFSVGGALAQPFGGAGQANDEVIAACGRPNHERLDIYIAERLTVGGRLRDGGQRHQAHSHKCELRAEHFHCKWIVIMSGPLVNVRPLSDVPRLNSPQAERG